MVREFLEDIREWKWPEAPPGGLIHSTDLPPKDYTLPKSLPPDIDARLMRGLRERGDQVAVGLLLARLTGMRVGELIALELNCLLQVAPRRHSLKIPLGKLHNERVIPVEREVVNLVRQLRQQRGHPPASVDPETGRLVERLLCSATGAPLNYRRFLRVIKSVAQSERITENVHPHRLRHTYGTELLRFGVSFAGVMRLLGHRSPGMTARYTQLTDEQLTQSYLAARAKARERYTGINRLGNATRSCKSQDLLEPIESTLGELIARVQLTRFDHAQPEKRQALRRVVERLRRLQRELPTLL
jgi:integrase